MRDNKSKIEASNAKRLCLFDLDGTLIDPFNAITTGIQHGLRSVGVDVEDRRQLTQFIGPPIRDSLREYGNFTEDEIELIVSNYRAYFAEKGIYENTLYPGVVDMLKQLKDAGYTLSIATSKLESSAVAILKYLEFGQYFDLVVGCEADGTRSHKSEVIKSVLDELDPNRQYLPVMIGDRKYDIIGAREMGIDSIGVLWGYGSREELMAEAPGVIVGSVGELREVLKDFSRGE